MENRAHAVVAISFLIVFSVAGALVFYWLSSGPGTPRAYRIVTQQSVAGLASQSKVMFKGLQVGRVQSVAFDPQDPSRVIIDFRVRRDAWISHATYAVLSKKGLIGGNVLQLKVGEGSHEPLPTSDSHPAHIPLHQGLIGRLEQSAQGNLQALHALLSHANDILDADNRQHIAATLKQLDVLTRRLAQLETQLAPTLAQLPAVLTAVQASLQQAQDLLANSDKLVTQAHAPLQAAGQLEATIDQLAHKLDNQTLPDAHELSQSLTRTSRLLQGLIRELKSRPQSLIFGPSAPRPGPGEPGFHDNRQ